VLTACSSETPNATPTEVTPSAIVETQAEETIQQTTVATEKSTEPTEVETVVAKTKTEHQVEAEIIEHVDETQTPAPTQKLTQDSIPKPTTKPTHKPTEKAKPEVEKIEPKHISEQNIQNMVSYLISHNQSKGMTYDSTLNTSNSGWLFAYQGCLNTTANRTYEEQLSRTVSGLDADIDSILALDGYATNYTQISFNCYAEKQANGTYNIYFCYG
jgi:outer membrane biosynthesis protein TonB